MRTRSIDFPQYSILPTLTELMQLQSSARFLQLSSYRRSFSSFTGGYASHLKGRGMEFHEVRAYQAGDDIRQMDWRVTARTGNPHVKLYHEEKERPVFFVMDYSPSMFFGTRVGFKSSIGAHIIALLAWAASQHGDRVGGMICSENQHVELQPKSRLAGILPLLKSLSSVSLPQTYTTTTNHLEKALERLRYLVHPGSLLILMSDFYQLSQNIERHLSHLIKHNEIIACSIHDPFEIFLPSKKNYVVSDGEKFLTINGYSKNCLKHYHEQYKKKHQQLITLMEKLKILLLEFRTDEAFMPTLSHFFGRHYG